MPTKCDYILFFNVVFVVLLDYIELHKTTLFLPFVVKFVVAFQIYFESFFEIHTVHIS